MHIITTESCEHSQITVLSMNPEDMLVIQQALYAYCKYREDWWEKAGKPTGMDVNWHTMLKAREVLGAWDVLMQPAVEWLDASEEKYLDEFEEDDEEESA